MDNTKSAREIMVDELKPISRQYSPSLFLPFILILIPLCLLAVLTFGVSLILSGFVWIVFDNYLFKFLTTGKAGFRQFFRWDRRVLRYFYTAIVRRIIMLLSLACFVVPCLILSPAMSMLPYVMDKHNEVSNPFKLIKMSVDAARVHLKTLILINLTTAYLYFLTIITLGILSPWSVPYLRMQKARLYCIANGIELHQDLVEMPEFEEDLPTTSSPMSAGLGEQEGR